MILPSPITGKIPKIAKDVFIAANATIIGDVTIYPGVNIWYGAVLRGDEGPLIIGANTSIQEHVAVHTEKNVTCKIGANCIVGHHAMVHGPCDVGDGCMVGINAVVLQGTTVGEGTMIGSGGVARKEIPRLSLIAGVPAVIKKQLPESRLEQAKAAAIDYVERGRKFREKFNHPDLEPYYFEFE